MKTREHQPYVVQIWRDRAHENVCTVDTLKAAQEAARRISQEHASATVRLIPPSESWFDKDNPVNYTEVWEAGEMKRRGKWEETTLVYAAGELRPQSQPDTWRYRAL